MAAPLTVPASRHPAPTLLCRPSDASVFRRISGEVASPAASPPAGPATVDVAGTSATQGRDASPVAQSPAAGEDGVQRLRGDSATSADEDGGPGGGGMMGMDGVASMLGVGVDGDADCMICFENRAVRGAADVQRVLVVPPCLTPAPGP